MPLAHVPTHINGHRVTEQERQLQRLLLAGESPVRIARLMGISRTEVSTLNKSLREKGLRPRRQRLSARRAVKSRARRAASDDTSLDVATRKHFGTHLRTMRTSHGLTQAALANGAFTAAFVSMIESGSASPSMKSLVHFARRLGVPLREVIPPDL